MLYKRKRLTYAKQVLISKYILALSDCNGQGLLFCPIGWYNKANGGLNMAEAGRPTKYSKELAETILTLMEEGKTLTDICKLDAMPVRSTVYLWMENNKDFSDAYNKAKVKSTHAMVENAYSDLMNVPVHSVWIGKDGRRYGDDEVLMLSPMERKELGLENVGLSPALVSLMDKRMHYTMRVAAIRNPEDYSEKRHLEMSGSMTNKVVYKTKDEEKQANNEIDAILNEQGS